MLWKCNWSDILKRLTDLDLMVNATELFQVILCMYFGSVMFLLVSSLHWWKYTDMTNASQ